MFFKSPKLFKLKMKMLWFVIIILFPVFVAKGEGIHSLKLKTLETLIHERKSLLVKFYDSNCQILTKGGDWLRASQISLIGFFPLDN